MMLCSSLWTRFQSWLRDYDELQSFAVFLLYVQIGFALVGSLGALYNGVSLVNLAIALFALVAIESGSQSLGRTYALLLLSAILLDFIWFLLFSYDIWHTSSEDYGTFFIFSLKLIFVMQILGLSVRISSSFLWIQMYRLGVSHVESAVSREGDFDLRNSFLTPSTPAVVRQPSDSEDPLGGSIYDPAYYYSLFEVGQNDRLSHEASQLVLGLLLRLCSGGGGSWIHLSSFFSTFIEFLLSTRGNVGDKDSDSSSQVDTCTLKLSLGNAFHAITDDNTASRSPSLE